MPTKLKETVGPAKMYIADTTRSDAKQDNTLVAQFNPTEFSETLSVNWNKLAVMGLSHMPLQYSQTDNHGFNVELMFHAIDDDGSKLQDIAWARRFLLSLCYPSRSAQPSIRNGAPPRAIFFWPQIVSITCIVRKIDIKHTMFNKQGDPIVFSAKVTLEEIRDARLYSEDVLSRGTQRDTGAGTGGL